MDIVKTYKGYCPVQSLDYFINVRYNICTVNRYLKTSSECCYISLYHMECPVFSDCPIFKKAPEIIENW